ncbi:hypothetical protein [Echinicola sp. 20G]|uniref:hypothetical protein n=1 Tax=Echinicola sp. 20G TaxID=2781961 RepID=UPI0019106B5F|nr:hypothetical protein [Echinicola sp. 20G]
MKYSLLFFVLLFSLKVVSVFGQQNAILHKDQEIKDSLRAITYPYVMPLLGNKVQYMGHELPLPFGVMFNYVHQATRLEITSLKVGIGELGPAEMDFVEFAPVQNSASVFNFRADTWLLPFLNVYGIYARSQGNANIDISFPLVLHIKTTPEVETFGGGLVLAYGKDKYFGAFNLNLSSSNTSALDEPVFGRVISLRLGRLFPLSNGKDKFSFSIGAQNQFVERRTAGSITIEECFASLDPEKLQDLKDEIASDAQNWYDGLTIVQKRVVDALVDYMGDWLDGKDVGSIPINYDFEKEVLGNWSLQLGAQYMSGKNLWYRVEGGFGKGRTQLLLSVNYRFGIKRNSR